MGGRLRFAKKARQYDEKDGPGEFREFIDEAPAAPVIDNAGTEQARDR
jgi:hypothetical protein